MSGRLHDCIADGCTEQFDSSSEASMHYWACHLGTGPRPTRPVSCWACAAEMPTHRQADGSVVAEACPRCGWEHPSQQAPAARALALILEEDGT